MAFCRFCVLNHESPRVHASLSRKLPKGLPRNIADRVSFATGGVKTANQVEEVEILWNAFKSVYKNEKLAVEAITKNAVPVQPQYSSPTKIKGTYKLLIDRFGKAAAADIIPCCAVPTMHVAVGSVSTADAAHTMKVVA